MGDFFQNGVITTLHRLGNRGIEQIERNLVRFSRRRPLSLILPSIYAELEGEALPQIVQVLKNIPYVSQIVITMGQTTEHEFQLAKKFFGQLPQEKVIIWNSGKRLQKIFDLLEKNDLPVGPDGKGRSVWTAFGYVIADGRSRVLALHDCDIITYDRELLARLAFPIMDPNLDYEFCKGYYSRVTDRMHGRVTRLFVTPLIRALKTILGKLPYLEYLDSFRYPLAGEFAMTLDLARINRIPGDWGLEIGMLAEVFRNTALKRVCQVDICESYEHKHQPLSPDDPSKGLLKMSVDIAKTIFRTLAMEGVVVSNSFITTLQVAYVRTAQDMIKRYEDDAALNNLYFDRHEEGLAVETFAKGIQMAGNDYMENPLDLPLIPNWNRVASAIPDIFDYLLEAIRDDNK